MNYDIKKCCSCHNEEEEISGIMAYMLIVSLGLSIFALVITVFGISI